MVPETIDLAAQRAFSATAGRGAFCIAVTGTGTDADSARYAEAIAAAGAGFGKRVMLVRAVNAAEALPAVEARDAARNCVAQPAGHCLLEVSRGSALHRALNDNKRLTEALDAWMEGYDAVVIDCPAFGEPNPLFYTPLTAAAADAVLLVALPSANPRHVFDAVMKWLGESGAALSALVLNDRYNPTLGQEMAREARRLRRIAPRFTRFIEDRVARWAPLNRYH